MQDFAPTDLLTPFGLFSKLLMNLMKLFRFRLDSL